MTTEKTLLPTSSVKCALTLSFVCFYTAACCFVIFNYDISGQSTFYINKYTILITARHRNEGNDGEIETEPEVPELAEQDILFNSTRDDNKLLSNRTTWKQRRRYNQNLQPKVEPLVGPIFLIWTPYFKKRGLRALNAFEDCPVKCARTTDRRLLSAASVVYFHGADLRASDLPIVRDDQVKHLTMLESPDRTSRFYNDWNKIPMSYFNTTSTYRNSSTYPNPYVNLVPLDPTLPSISEEEVSLAVARKTKGIFSLMSHCHAEGGRDDVIRAMNQRTPVDRFGDCDGSQSCDVECEKKLIENYHFYLAFENTVCKEYITEKLARMKKLVVPITLKRSVVPSNVPAGSFIAVDDYCSIEKMTEHLDYLMGNKTAYAEYFSWTKSYSITARVHPMCQLCIDAAANKIRTDPTLANYASVREYMPKSECDRTFSKQIISRKCIE